MMPKALKAYLEGLGEQYNRVIYSKVKKAVSKYSITMNGVFSHIGNPCRLSRITSPTLSNMHQIRVFRVLKLFNFWIEGQMLLTALRDSSKKIAVFFMFVVILVISIGTLMYMIEGGKPNTQFSNIPNSIYWACVTLTTVGYGDITPVTALGKFLSGCVMLIGYTIIAVPTGIVSVSLMKRHEKNVARECPNCHRRGHEESAQFCKYCGSSLDKAPKE